MKPIKRRDFVKMSTLGSMGLILGCSGGRNFDLIIRNGLMLDGLGGLGFDGCAVAPYGKLALGKPHPRYYVVHFREFWANMHEMRQSYPWLQRSKR